MAVKRRRRKARRNAPARRVRRRVKRNAWKGGPRRHSKAAKKGWRTRRRKMKVAAVAKPKRRKRRKARGKGWKGSRQAHRVAAVIGWAGKKRRGGKRKISYMKRRGVTKRKLRSYRKRHRPAARRRTPVTMWGQVAANPKRRRRSKRKSVRRNRRRSYRRARRAYSAIRRNPSMAGTMMASVTQMFKTDVLRSVVEIAAGGVVAGVASTYLNSQLDNMINVKAKISGWLPEYADKIIYVYDKAFTLATAGLLGYGASRLAKMAGMSAATQNKIQSSIAIGGASLVAIQVVSDAVGMVAGKLGIGLAIPQLTQGDYATPGQLDSLIERQIKSELRDYVSPNEIVSARRLGDYASVDQIVSAPTLEGNDFEDDMGAMATMGENIEEKF